MPKDAKLRRGGLRPAGVSTADAQRDARFFKERERERQANAEKTMALRALRLAKEAALAAEAAANPVPAATLRKRKPARALTGLDAKQGE